MAPLHPRRKLLNLSKLVKDNLFKEGRFYGAKVISISIPSLSDRTKDIPLRTPSHFLSKTLTFGHSAILPRLSALSDQPIQFVVYKMNGFREAAEILGINHRTILQKLTRKK